MPGLLEGRHLFQCRYPVLIRGNTVTQALRMNFFFVVDLGPTLGSKIPVTSKHHSQYINAATSSLEQTEEEFKTAYFSLKRNKSLGYD